MGEQRRTGIVAAFLAVYLIWGSTYLAMRYVVETLPPFTAAAARFLVSGLLLLVLQSRRRPVRPTRAQWTSATIVGAFLLLGGNGMVMWAEQTVDSGFAALIIATVPLWMVLLQAGMRQGTRPDLWTVVGLLVGFAGVAVLVHDPSAAGTPKVLGALALVFAAFSWSIGSLLSRRLAGGDALLMTGLQMVGGGTLLLLVGMLAGEFRRIDLEAVTWQSWTGLLYLIFFGSMIGYTCYVWLLQVTTPANVSTYAYVNPLVAVLLGAWIAHEVIGPRTLLGAAGVLLAVIVVVTPRSALRLRRAKRAPGAEAGSAPDR